MTTIQSTQTDRPADDSWRPGARKRKNTKRWCKGHVGREHVSELTVSTRWTRVYTCGRPAEGRASYSGSDPDWTCYHEEVCQNCGKVLRWSIPKVDCRVFRENPEQLSGITLSSTDAPY